MGGFLSHTPHFHATEMLCGVKVKGRGPVLPYLTQSWIKSVTARLDAAEIRQVRRRHDNAG